MWHIDYRYSKSIKRNKRLLTNRAVERKLAATTVSNGLILPYRREKSMTYGLGGVLDAGRAFVPASAFFLLINKSQKPDWGGAYPYKEEEAQRLEEKVIFGGFLNNNEWGHFLTDWSVRLWYAATEDTKSKVVFCQRGTADLHPNIQTLLKYAGLPKERLLFLKEGDPPLRCAEIVIPEASLMPEGYTREYRFLFEKAVRAVRALDLPYPRYEKLYMTRTGLEPKKDFGEEELEECYRKNGYQVLRPEALSVEEQIYYLSYCRELVSLEGSAAHGIVFAPPGLRQTILEKTQAVNERQIVLQQCFETDVSYVGTYPRFKFYDYYSDGPFLVGITSDFLHYAKTQEFTERPKKSIIIWLRNYLKYFTARPARRIRQLIGKISRKLARIT